MILTVTLNPSMDYIYHKEHFNIGAHNRFENPSKMPAGKGINCARATTYLGGDVLALSVTGGMNGRMIRELLKNENFKNEFIEINEESRNAITIMHDGGLQTEIVEAGPFIDDATKEIIFTKIFNLIDQNAINIITINGSVNTDDEYFYLNLLKQLRNEYGASKKILMDLSGIQLEHVINSSEVSPNFMKPNIEEFSELVGKKLTNKKEVHAALLDINTNIDLLLVSCGSDGAVAKFRDAYYDISIPKVTVINPTGSGDSTVGGAAYALDKGMDIVNILKYAIASGTANAMETGVGVVNPDNLNKLMDQIHIVAI